MSIKAFNIFIIGVGGQGIGLLSEIIQRSIDHANVKCIGVDTHGLAQRGGTVTSHVRMGNEVYSPLIRNNNADLILSLERHEALRALNDYSKINACLVFYDAVWQPLAVRMNIDKQIERSQIEDSCKHLQVAYHPIFIEDLNDSKMQNICVLAYIAKKQLIPELNKEHYISALNDVMKDNILDKNLVLFDKIYNSY